jgi:hypothetical protein
MLVVLTYDLRSRQATLSLDLAHRSLSLMIWCRWKAALSLDLAPPAALSLDHALPAPSRQREREIK